MADFRKWFLAFAVVAILTSFAVPASAQLAPALQCVANAGVPPTVRAEGLTELVGDLVLNCNGGIPTLSNNLVPQANVTIFLSTNITSRLLDSASTSEALLLIDEPHSTSNTTTPLNYCGAQGQGNFFCSIPGAPSGNGIGTYNGSTGRPNVFVGRQTGVNQVTFFGIPIDPPGTNGTRVIRITNIRANANQLGVSSTLVPTQITAYVSITGSTSVPINNPQQTVAFVQPGLVFARVGTPTFIQCFSQSAGTAANNSTAFTGGQFNQFSTRFTEGFGSAWKVRNISEVLAGGYVAADLNQNVPGAIYNTETGFLNSATDPAVNPPGYTGPALNSSGDGNPTTAGIGTATQGTRLMVSFNSIPNGTSVFVPTTIVTTNALTAVASGRANLVVTDANGAGPYSAVGTGAPTGFSATSIVNGSAVAVYEIVQSDPFAIETMSVPVSVVYAANVGSNLPAPGVTATATGSFAPLSNIGVASTTAPIPRFAPSTTPTNAFTIVKCSCNILFPFVTNQQGYDTGIAISNTSLDTINGVTPQQGTVTLAYYGGGTPPPNYTTNAPVPGGAQVLFTLSGGGNYGIPATPGFQGYIVAQAQFQYCHAFAYISAQGALPTAPGASESYLGLILDQGGLFRTLQIGESLAH